MRNVLNVSSTCLHFSRMDGLAKTPGEAQAVAHRGQMIGLHRAGKSIMAISREMGVSAPTVRRWVRRYHEEDNLSTRARSGRPRVTPPETDRRIVELSRGNPMSPATDIVRQLNVDCHVETVRRRLKEAGRLCRTPARKEELTARNIDQRLQFVEEHR